VSPRPRFGADGLVPAIVQDADSGAVLMLAHMNDEAWDRTVRTGQAWFWSRSRAELWEKGATSGNRMAVVEIRLDCDDDSVLLRVHPAGPACHTGEPSCFFTIVVAGPAHPD
jgi:phosphoribosyl-AMP cyclohydrolase